MKMEMEMTTEEAIEVLRKMTFREYLAIKELLGEVKAKALFIVSMSVIEDSNKK